MVTIQRGLNHTWITSKFFFPSHAAGNCVYLRHEANILGFILIIVFLIISYYYSMFLFVQLYTHYYCVILFQGEFILLKYWCAELYRVFHRSVTPFWPTMSGLISPGFKFVFFTVISHCWYFSFCKQVRFFSPVILNWYTFSWYQKSLVTIPRHMAWSVNLLQLIPFHHSSCQCL